MMLLESLEPKDKTNDGFYLIVKFQNYIKKTRKNDGTQKNHL
jgi:hypothetical protein